MRSPSVCNSLQAELRGLINRTEHLFHRRHDQLERLTIHGNRACPP